MELILDYGPTIFNWGTQIGDLVLLVEENSVYLGGE